MIRKSGGRFSEKTMVKYSALVPDSDVRKAPDLAERAGDADRGMEQMGTAQTFFVEHIETPTGRMRIVSDEAERLRAVDWNDHEGRMLDLLRRYYGPHAVRLRKTAARQARSWTRIARPSAPVKALAPTPAKALNTRE